MALGSITLTQLLVVLVVVTLLFGTRKLAGVGEDLGNAIKGFRKAIGDEPPAPPTLADPASLPTAEPVQPVCKDDVRQTSQ